MAEVAESSDEALIHFAGEDHEGNVAGFCVGDAESGDEFTLLAEGFKHAGQLHAAAVDYRDLIAVAHEFGDGASAAFEERWSFKACATEFYDVLHARPSAGRFMRGPLIQASPA